MEKGALERASLNSCRRSFIAADMQWAVIFLEASVGKVDHPFESINRTGSKASRKPSDI
jgi:hypothetical protein